MSNIELTLNETSSLEFETDITGITNESVDVQFIIESDGYGMTFKGNLVDGVVTVDFPILTNVLEAKTYDAKLVFIIEGTKYFTPMTTKVDFVQPISISTEVKTTPKTVVKEDNNLDGIKIGTVKVTKVKPIMERLKEALPDLASAKNIGALLSVYNKDVLLNENAKTDVKDAVDFINAYLKDASETTFKDYIAESK